MVPHPYSKLSAVACKLRQPHATRLVLLALQVSPGWGRLNLNEVQKKQRLMQTPKKRASVPAKVKPGRRTHQHCDAAASLARGLSSGASGHQRPRILHSALVLRLRQIAQVRSGARANSRPLILFF